MQSLLDIAKNTATNLLPKIGGLLASKPGEIGQNAIELGKTTLGGLSKDVVGMIPGLGDKNKEALGNFASSMIDKIPGIKGPGGNTTPADSPSAVQKPGTGSALAEPKFTFFGLG